MKITAYEVRPDEAAWFQEISRDRDISLTLIPEPLTEENVAHCRGADGVSILGHSILGEKLLTQLKDMGVKVVSTRTVGCNHIDLDKAREIGMPVCNTCYGPECVADYTVMLLLLCIRKYKQVLWRMQINDYSLDGLEGKQVGSMTVGVVGTGRIGRQVMQDLSGFGCKFLCYDPYPHPVAARLGEYVSLEELWERSDVITLHAPLTPENYHMVDRQTLAKMKPGVILLNAARGGLMDMEAVIEAVENRQIGALGLDVFENEDGIYHENLRDDIIKNRSMAYLRQFPNVVMTPHMAFYTQEAVQSMVYGSVDSIVDVCKTGSAQSRIV